jgi:hypothetical protein
MKPVGEIKKIVSLVDRGAFDEYVYPANADLTVFQPPKPRAAYHNYTQETVTWPFVGHLAWGSRVTFDVPWPWQNDMLNWIALRLKPASWLSQAALRHLGPEIADWVPLDPMNIWVWANSLGTVAIERAEMEVDGVIVEQFSGDWLNVWNKTMQSTTRGVAFDDAVYGSTYKNPTINNINVSDDGYVYCYLPFWFAKHVNTAYPLLSSKGPHNVRFHITLRPFKDVVRKLGNPRTDCDETPLGQTFRIRDYSFPFRVHKDVTVDPVVPGFMAADIVAGVSNIDGELRKAYITAPHEILMEPVIEQVFAEPLKYTINKPDGNSIHVGLPLSAANGPLRQIMFFLRRNDVSDFSDWNNYSAVAQPDPVWNPGRPLLEHAQLMVGTAVWADQPERWWRAAGDLALPGGVRAYGNYIYAYNFAEKPAEFGPSGSVNASRVDLRLNLRVAAPNGVGEWSVHVFLIGTNWMRFQNGLANLLFMD